MALKVYNSLTRKKEDFKPSKEGRVTMYVCGPTVYDLSHIGHGRSAVSFDVIYRYLRFRGYEVIYARNYTDIDDKIINRAKEKGVPPLELAESYIRCFDEDMEALGVELPTVRPRATETIKKIIEVTRALEEKGFAYKSGGDVYYSVRKFGPYGTLSGKKIDELEAGARVEVGEKKEDPLDFALWKASKPGEPSWESPWGPGRPGWHIECSAMIMERLGDTIDIHGGGKDLLFPHHENEIAQSEAASGRAPFVRYWLHNGFVNIEKVKMSKSLGNILNIRDVLRDHTSEAVRLFLLSSHYRNPVDYSEDSLKEAEAAAERFYKTLERVREEYPDAQAAEVDAGTLRERLKPLEEAMDDDFNTAGVLGLVFREVTRVNRLMDEAKWDVKTKDECALAIALFKAASGFLGIFGKRPEEYFSERKKRARMSAEEIERLVRDREEARKSKDFKTADAIRETLAGRGIVLEDTPRGTVWSVRN